MAIQTITWSSDSCGCVIQFDSDTSVTPPIVSNFQQISICPAHATLTGTTDQKVQNIRNENARGPSNTFSDIIAASGTELTQTLADGSKEFKGGVTAIWSWSGTAPDRVLNITITGASLTQNQKSSIQNKLNTRFGAGNVVVTYG